MHAEITPYTHTTESDVPIACIDTLDEEYTEPIRQYLSTYGYSVYVNNRIETLVRYHIIAGDSYFVKTFLQTHANTHTERLVIVWDAHAEDMRMFADSHVKIVLADKRTLTDEDVQEFLRFYFIGKDTLLDLQTHKGSLPPKLPTVQTVDRSAHEEIISQVSMTEETEMHERTVIPDGSEEPRVFDDRSVDRQRIEALVSDVYHTDAPKKSEKRRQAWPTVTLAITAIFLPIIWYGVNILLASSAIIFNVQLIRTGASDTVPAVSRIGLFGVTQSTAMIPLLMLPFRILRDDSIRMRLEQFSTVVENILKAEIIASETIAVSRKLSASLLSPVGSAPDDIPPAVGIERVRTGISFINHRLGVAHAILSNLILSHEFPFSLPAVSLAGTRAYQSLHRMRETTTQIEHLLYLYPQIAGFRQTQTYLVLFQNSMELRPTGGFIGSLALAHVRDGKLVDFTIQDVYAVDGQLKGHVDPPTPIRELLSQEHWYLRDSNWDPDFRASGERALWFYEKETGTRVDGVIAISIPFMVDLLGAIGPIDLPDFNDRITAENFFGKSLFYTQSDFFPGSTQKKDFLGSLASALLLKITEDQHVSPAGIYDATIRALQRRDIMFYFADTDSQSLASRYGWAGEVELKKGCALMDNACIPHGLAVVDANLSVNKVNYFMKSSRIRLIDISQDGNISETMTLTYENSSRGDEQGGGTYRNYARMYLPEQSTVDGIHLDGVLIEEKRVASDSAQFELPYWESFSASSAGQIVGIAFDVSPGQERNLSLSFHRNVNLFRPDTNTILGIYDYKQPGVSGIEEQGLIRYPLTLSASVDAIEGGSVQTEKVSEIFLAKQGQLEYNTSLSSDFSLRVRFTKQ